MLKTWNLQQKTDCLLVFAQAEMFKTLHQEKARFVPASFDQGNSFKRFKAEAFETFNCSRENVQTLNQLLASFNCPEKQFHNVESRAKRISSFNGKKVSRLSREK